MLDANAESDVDEGGKFLALTDFTGPSTSLAEMALPSAPPMDSDSEEEVGFGRKPSHLAVADEKCCSICMDREKNAVIVDCGHLCM